MKTRFSPLVLAFLAVAMTATSADARWRRCRQQACWSCPQQQACWPCRQPGFGACEPHLAGNPAPGTGYYVQVYVFSNQETWYYGPCSYDDAEAAFNTLYNPNTQFTGVPQVIQAGTILKPYGG